jgi:hypothetical protein
MVAFMEFRYGLHRVAVAWLGECGMDEVGARAEVEQLRRQIERHDYLYYVLDQPVIPDAEYDAPG